jgi:hypothetical protein
MPRQRAPDEIRAVAIRLAIQKTREGCLPCAQSYFDLAKRNGATEVEIESAIADTEKNIPSGVGRREFLKLATAALLGVAVAELGLKPTTVEAGAYYYGTDSNSKSCSTGIPQNFYIGRFGYGTTSSTAYFRKDAAQAAGYYRTYEYWGIVGPSSRPPGVTPYNWGTQQGNMACQQWFSNPNYYLVGAYTIFGDVEPGFGGWSETQADMRSVLNGFLDAVGTYGAFTPGVYTSPNYWNSYFGSSFVPSRVFVLWVTGCRTCTIGCCPCKSGCSNADTISQVDSNVPSVANTYFGGSRAIVWQYWISACACSGGDAGDYDASIESPYLNFQIQTGPTYQSGC